MNKEFLLDYIKSLEELEINFKDIRDVIKEINALDASSKKKFEKALEYFEIPKTIDLGTLVSFFSIFFIPKKNFGDLSALFMNFNKDVDEYTDTLNRFLMYNNGDISKKLKEYLTIYSKTSIVSNRVNIKFTIRIDTSKIFDLAFYLKERLDTNIFELLEAIASLYSLSLIEIMASLKGKKKKLSSGEGDQLPDLPAGYIKKEDIIKDKIHKFRDLLANFVNEYGGESSNAEIIFYLLCLLYVTSNVFSLFLIKLYEYFTEKQGEPTYPTYIIKAYTLLLSNNLISVKELSETIEPSFLDRIGEEELKKLSSNLMTFVSSSKSNESTFLPLEYKGLKFNEPNKDIENLLLKIREDLNKSYKSLKKIYKKIFLPLVYMSNNFFEDNTLFNNSYYIYNSKSFFKNNNLNHIKELIEKFESDPFINRIFVSSKNLTYPEDIILKSKKVPIIFYHFLKSITGFVNKLEYNLQNNWLSTVKKNEHPKSHLFLMICIYVSDYLLPTISNILLFFSLLHSFSFLTFKNKGALRNIILKLDIDGNEQEKTLEEIIQNIDKDKEFGYKISSYLYEKLPYTILSNVFRNNSFDSSLLDSFYNTIKRHLKGSNILDRLEKVVESIKDEYEEEHLKSIRNDFRIKKIDNYKDLDLKDLEIFFKDIVDSNFYNRISGNMILYNILSFSFNKFLKKEALEMLRVFHTFYVAKGTSSQGDFSDIELQFSYIFTNFKKFIYLLIKYNTNRFFNIKHIMVLLNNLKNNQLEKILENINSEEIEENHPYKVYKSFLDKYSNFDENFYSPKVYDDFRRKSKIKDSFLKEEENIINLILSSHFGVSYTKSHRKLENKLLEFIKEERGIRELDINEVNEREFYINLGYFLIQYLFIYPTFLADFIEFLFRGKNIFKGFENNFRAGEEELIRRSLFEFFFDNELGDTEHLSLENSIKKVFSIYIFRILSNKVEKSNFLNFIEKYVEDKDLFRILRDALENNINILQDFYKYLDDIYTGSENIELIRDILNNYESFLTSNAFNLIFSIPKHVQVNKDKDLTNLGSVSSKLFLINILPNIILFLSEIVVSAKFLRSSLKKLKALDNEDKTTTIKKTEKDSWILNELYNYANINSVTEFYINKYFNSLPIKDSTLNGTWASDYTKIDESTYIDNAKSFIEENVIKKLNLFFNSNDEIIKYLRENILKIYNSIDKNYAFSDVDIFFSLEEVIGSSIKSDLDRKFTITMNLKFRDEKDYNNIELKNLKKEGDNISILTMKDILFNGYKHGYISYEEYRKFLDLFRIINVDIAFRQTLSYEKKRKHNTIVIRNALEFRDLIKESIEYYFHKYKPIREKHRDEEPLYNTFNLKYLLYSSSFDLFIRKGIYQNINSTNNKIIGDIIESRTNKDILKNYYDKRNYFINLLKDEKYKINIKNNLSDFLIFITNISNNEQTLVKALEKMKSKVLENCESKDIIETLENIIFEMGTTERLKDSNSSIFKFLEGDLNKNSELFFNFINILNNYSLIFKINNNKYIIFNDRDLKEVEIYALEELYNYIKSSYENKPFTYNLEMYLEKYMDLLHKFNKKKLLKRYGEDKDLSSAIEKNKYEIEPFHIKNLLFNWYSLQDLSFEIYKEIFKFILIYGFVDNERRSGGIRLFKEGVESFIKKDVYNNILLLSEILAKLFIRYNQNIFPSEELISKDIEIEDTISIEEHKYKGKDSSDKEITLLDTIGTLDTGIENQEIPTKYDFLDTSKLVPKLNKKMKEIIKKIIERKKDLDVKESNVKFIVDEFSSAFSETFDVDVNVGNLVLYSLFFNKAIGLPTYKNDNIILPVSAFTKFIQFGFKHIFDYIVNKGELNKDFIEEFDKALDFYLTLYGKDNIKNRMFGKNKTVEIDGRNNAIYFLKKETESIGIRDALKKIKSPEKNFFILKVIEEDFYDIMSEKLNDLISKIEKTEENEYSFTVNSDKEGLLKVLKYYFEAFEFAKQGTNSRGKSFSEILKERIGSRIPSFYFVVDMIFFSYIFNCYVTCNNTYFMVELFNPLTLVKENDINETINEISGNISTEDMKKFIGYFISKLIEKVASRKEKESKLVLKETKNIIRNISSLLASKIGKDSSVIEKEFFKYIEEKGYYVYDSTSDENVLQFYSKQPKIFINKEEVPVTKEIMLTLFKKVNLYLYFPKAGLDLSYSDSFKNFYKYLENLFIYY